MLEAEYILATTGVLAPEPPDPTDIAAASALGDAWTARIREWVSGKGIARYKLPPQRDYKSVREQLRKPLTDTQERALAGVLVVRDPAVGADYTGMLKAAREYLLGLYPLIEIPSSLGPEELPPPPDRSRMWLATVAVVQDPDRVFDELEMNSLERAQAQAFKDMYPESRQLVLEAMFDELRQMRDRGVKTLPRDRESMIRTLGLLQLDSPLIPEEQPPEEAPAEAEAPDLRAQEKQAPQERVVSPLR